MTFKTTKICSGSYVVTSVETGMFVYINRVDYGYGDEWVADAKVNCSDPSPTKREAVESAKFMMARYGYGYPADDAV